MKNAMSMVFLARRILTKFNSPASTLRYYCSPPSSSSHPPKNRLFVGGSSISLSLSTHTYTFVTLCPSTYLDNDLWLLGVSGLSWSVDEKSLKDAFSSFGEVTEGIMWKHYSRSVGLYFPYMLFTRYSTKSPTDLHCYWFMWKNQFFVVT